MSTVEAPPPNELIFQLLQEIRRLPSEPDASRRALVGRLGSWIIGIRNLQAEGITTGPVYDQFNQGYAINYTIEFGEFFGRVMGE